MKFVFGPIVRDGNGSLPTGWNNTTSGVRGIVTNVNWGDLMWSGLYTAAAGFSPVGQPAAQSDGFIDGIGSNNFFADRNALESSTVGSGAMNDIISDMNTIENDLAAGSRLKIRFFSGVGSSGPYTNPPAPAWLSTLCGTFQSNDANSGTPYWVSNSTLAAIVAAGNVDSNGDPYVPAIVASQQLGDTVCSPTNGLQYTCNDVTALGSNSVDPGSVSNPPGWTTGKLGPYAGPCVRWFGPAAGSYLAAYAYFQLILANTRVWVNVNNYTTAGQGGSGATWTAGVPGSTYTGAVTQFTLDTCPIVGEITMSACCTIYGENSIRQIGSGTGSGNASSGPHPNAQYSDITSLQFFNAGYTTFSGLKYIGTNPNVWSSANQNTGLINSPAADSDVGQILACHNACAAAWVNTSISEAHNPFQIQEVADVQSGSTTSNTVTQNIIAHLVSVCAKGQAVPGNNSLHGAYAQDTPIIDDINSAQPPGYFQTAQKSIVTTKGNTVADCIIEAANVGAINLELPSGFQTVTGTTTNALLQALTTEWLGWIANGTGPSSGNAKLFSSAGANATVFASMRQPTAVGGNAPVLVNQTPPSTAQVGVAYGPYQFTTADAPAPLFGCLNIRGATGTLGYASADYRQASCGYVPVSSTSPTGTIYISALFTNTSGTITITPSNPIDDALTEVALWNSGYPTTLTSASISAIATAHTNSTNITSLGVVALGYGYPSGSVTVTQGATTQTFTTTGAAIGATSIPVTAAVPTKAFTSAASVAAVTTQQRLKIRISGGIHSSSWMYAAQYGGSFSMLDPTQDVKGTQTCPCFWDQRYQNLFYNVLMAKLAAEYDTNPLIAQMVATPNMTFYPEYGLRQDASVIKLKTTPPTTEPNPNMVVMLQAGYRAGDANTPYTDIWNQIQSVSLMAALWPNTITAFVCNPYQNLDIIGPLTTTTGMTNNQASPTTFIGFTIPSSGGNAQPVPASGDSILIRDYTGASQTFTATGACTTTKIVVGSETCNLATQSSYEIYDVQGSASDATAMTWNYHNDASDPPTMELLITAAQGANPNVSLENDSWRNDYIGATAAASSGYTTIYNAMTATLPASPGPSGTAIGIQLAQYPEINGDSGPTEASMIALMNTVGTTPSTAQPTPMGASHVELFPATSSNPGYDQFMTVADVKAAAAQLLPPPTGSSSLAETYSAVGLPAGITITSSGLLSGTPTVATSGTPASSTVTVTNAAGTDSVTFTITVAAASGGGGTSPVITADDPPDAVLGSTFSYQFGATGATSWTANPANVAAGLNGLPAGLSLSSTGLLSGTITGSPLLYTFTVNAINSTGTTISDPITIDVFAVFTPSVSVVQLPSGFYSRIISS